MDNKTMKQEIAKMRAGLERLNRQRKTIVQVSEMEHYEIDYETSKKMVDDLEILLDETRSLASRRAAAERLGYV